jgi:hypothetical protein
MGEECPLRRHNELRLILRFEPTSLVLRLVVKVKDLNHEHSLTINSTKAMDRGCGSDKLTCLMQMATGESVLCIYCDFLKTIKINEIYIIFSIF